MPTTREIRDWLAVNGHPEMENGKGRIPDALRARAEAALGNGGPPGDWGPGAAEADFATAADPPEPEYSPPIGAGIPAGTPGNGQPEDHPPGSPAAPPGPAAETPPRRPPPRPRGKLFSRRPKPQPAPGPKHPRKVRNRLSVAPLIEETYADLASAAGAIPPLQRLLYAQAPVAGVILDPVAKDTFLDRVALQPMVRNYERMRVGMALAGTPAFLMMALATAPRPVIEGGRPALQVLTDDDGQPVLDGEGAQILVPRFADPDMRHLTAMLGLRYCCRAMAELSGGALERVQARAAENEAREQAVDEFMAFLLGQPVAPAREEADRRAGMDAGMRLAGAGK